MDLMTPSLGLIFWQSVIFLISFIILSKFAWNPINKLLEKREKYIIDSINNAEKAKEYLKKIKLQKRNILKKTENMKNFMINEALKKKEQIEKEAKKKAKLESYLIINKTQLLIENKKKIAIEKIKNEILNMSIIISEKILNKELEINETNHNYFFNKIINNYEVFI
ncbi:F0F1 ATP synthase subunit B [Candidatus Karelsulcia muelleri]|uniref:ATP synthase subunit b n=1 Tax=Candidatus Karelsulcia muelleri TaxID=336810 RepID=A0A3A1ML88_9FLAO|nr:F0F1 ATP synthase subunit B [Candidatus Karelsulcia muelleri]RIU86095.1 ATP synthase F0 subunit B [Candidatus Karelsulcia muelleri]